MNHQDDYRHGHGHRYDIPTKEIGELLEIVSQKAPKLIKDLISTLYSDEGGSSMGKGIGNFYKELVNAGIPADEALKMTKDYMNMIPRTVVSNIPGAFSNSKTD